MDQVERQEEAATGSDNPPAKRSAPAPSADEPAYKRAMHAALPPKRPLPMMPSEGEFSDPPETTRTPSGAGASPVPKTSLSPPAASIAQPVLDTAPKSALTVSPPLQPRPSSKAVTTNKKTASASEKGSKGLRHFSMEVCKKVEEKGTTTYNEVADELVKKVLNERRQEDPNGKFDEKNIRRRVYDALNVLMAMDIISKEKKQISWKGLPTSAHHDLQMLEREESYRKDQVENKRRALQEILIQQICFRNLVSHNKERETGTVNAEKVPLPFIVVNTHQDAVINCNMAPDLSNVALTFDRPFETNDDNSILARLGLHRTTIPALREMVPDDLVNYCQEHGLLDSVLGGGDELPPGFSSGSGSRNKARYFKSLE